MKKGNIFMLAYIDSLFIVVIFWEYTGDNRQGTQITLAVTCASYLFAIADYLYCISDDKGATAAIKIKRCISIKKTIDEILKNNRIQQDIYDNALLFLKMNKDKATYIEEAYLDVSSYTPPYGDMDKIIQEMAIDFSKMLNESTTQKQNIIKYIKFADIFMFAGFLGFLCIFLFEGLLTFIIPVQNILTILAFGFVMLNYYLKDVFLDRKAQQSLKSEELIKKFESLSLKIEEQYAYTDKINKLLIKAKDTLTNA